MYRIRQTEQSGQHGFTLVELMIAMVLGLLLMGALLSMLGQARNSFRLDESYASMQDESRFAVRELSDDLRMAGYVTSVLMPDNVNIDASTALIVDCVDGGGDPWAISLQEPGTGEDTFLMALDNTTGAAAAAQFSCLTASQVVAGTDIVAIKRAAGSTTATADLAAGDIAIRTNGTVASLFVEPITTPLAGPFQNWLYAPVIYFIRNFAQTAGDGIPALCRMFLQTGAPPTMQTECIAEGIENLQIEYGVDINGDGAINSYVTNPTQAQLEQTISIRFFLLARTTDPDRAVDNTKTYAISNAADFVPNDNFHRRVFATTVSVANARNRILLGL